jgi:hypothetical protein
MDSHVRIGWRGQKQQTIGITPKIKKRGVPRPHEDMPPGNSFPQICVVSVHKIVVTGKISQEYLRVVAISNHVCLLSC